MSTRRNCWSGSRREFLAAGSTTVLGTAMTGGWFGQASVLRADETTASGCSARIRDAFHGPTPSLSTPFTRRGEIDFDAAGKMLDFMIDAKAKAIILTMGDSLFTTLADDEVAQLTEFVCRHVNKRALVVAADKSWWTGKDVEFAAYCAQLGADLLMVLPPDWAASCTVESLVAHYQAVSQKIPVMVVDNYLAERPLPFALELVGRLRGEVPGIVALKDDAGKELARRIALLTHDHWALVAAGKELHMNVYPYGVDGWMSTYMTFKPEIARRYQAAIEAHDLTAARAILRDYELPLLEFLGTLEGGFDAGIHGLLEIYGMAERYRRPPYHSLTDAQMQSLATFLKEKRLL